MLEAHQDSEGTLGVQLDIVISEIEKRERALEIKIDDAENIERRNNICVLNIPESTNEAPSVVPALLQKVIGELLQDEGGLLSSKGHIGAPTRVILPELL